MRWGFVVILLIFVAISWGVRVLLSQQVTEKVHDKQKTGDDNDGQ